MPKVRLKKRKRADRWFFQFWLACLGVTFLLMVKTLALAQVPSVFLVFRSFDSTKTVWEISFESDAHVPCRLRGSGHVDLDKLKKLEEQHCADLARLGGQVKQQLKAIGTKKAFRLKPKHKGIEVRGYGAVLPITSEGALEHGAAAELFRLLTSSQP